MRSYLTWRTGALAASGIVLVALAFSGTARAVTDTVFRYSTPKTGFFSVNAQGFAPRGANTANDYGISIADGLRVGTNPGFFTAAVHLPHGAKVTAVTVWYRDKGEITLLRRNVSTGAFDVPASQDFAGGGGTLKFGNINLDSAPITIDNQRFTYVLQTFVEPGGTFYDARIKYTYANAGE